MAASGSSSLDSGVPARFHFKLHTKLDKLDPTKRLAISDWLITFRAACVTSSDDFFVVFERPFAKSVAEWRVSADGQELNIENDSRKPAFRHDDELSDEYAQYSASYIAHSRQICSWLLTLVLWQLEPELKVLVKGTPSVAG